MKACLLLIWLLNLVFVLVKFGCHNGVSHSSMDQMTRKAGYIFQAVLFWDDQITANALEFTQIEIYFNFNGLGFFKVATLRECRKCEKYSIC